ncbi:MAG: DUF58 domain-containing protein [Schleiferiaceae bacterium]|nr:DUF58 domain-containing protein [Schleiferiaceae bacterium]
MDTKELLKKVRKIEIKTRRLSENLFSGEYHSSFKGRGMAFSEVRPYQIGDDIRAIDWNVTARLSEPYIKVFEEERELTLMLVVDISGSGLFGAKRQTKKEMITEICATLAFSALTNNDKVGVLLFSDQVELFIPPKKGKSHVLRIIRELIEHEPKSRGTNIGVALEYLNQVVKKRTILFLLSDFMAENYSKPLQISGKRHDMTCIRVFDPLEVNLPNLGLIAIKDSETGKASWLDTSSTALRREWNKKYNKLEQDFKTSVNKSGAKQIAISLNDSYVKALMGYFKSSR